MKYILTGVAHRVNFMPKGLQKSTKQRLASILLILKSVPQIHLRGIARTLKMNPFTISTLIDRYLTPFVDIEHTDLFGFRFKIIKLKAGKENTTLEDVLRYYETKKKIKNSGL